MSEPAIGQVMTVRGPVRCDEIGPTSMHDHVFWDCRQAWWTPQPFEHPELVEQPVTVETAAIARWNALAMRDNLYVGPEAFAEQAAELGHFVAAGGSCLVDLTCVGIGPYPEDLVKISAWTGLHIVAGAGFYVHASHPEWIERADVTDVEEAIHAQVTAGIGGTSVRPGIIGEIGTSVDFPSCERTVVRAAARVAARTGTSMNVHTTAPSRHAETIVELCADEGLSPSRLAFSHLDEVVDPSYHSRVLASGATIGIDSFGTDFGFGDLWSSPRDAEKMQLLVADIEAGYEDQLVIGHDVSLKASLKRFGGYGYDHILRRIVPTLNARLSRRRRPHQQAPGAQPATPPDAWRRWLSLLQLTLDPPRCRKPGEHGSAGPTGPGLSHPVGAHPPYARPATPAQPAAVA